jgi:hypothetical protein
MGNDQLEKEGEGRFFRTIAEKIPLRPPLAKGECKSTRTIPKECVLDKSEQP